MATLTNTQVTDDASEASDVEDCSVSTLLKSSHTGEETADSGGAKLLEESIISAETEAVGRSKRIMLVLLIFVALGAAFLTYFFAAKAERESFQKQVSLLYAYMCASKHKCRGVSHLSVIFNILPVECECVRDPGGRGTGMALATAGRYEPGCFCLFGCRRLTSQVVFVQHAIL